jgi:hypothetical protein
VPLRPIEAELRADPPQDATTVVVRGGPLTIEKLVQQARREQAVYSYRGQPLASISVDATVGEWTVDAILRERLWSRSSYAVATVEVLVAAGFELLPTFGAPHYDVVLPAATIEVASSLLSLFGPAQRNPYRRRR